MFNGKPDSEIGLLCSVLFMIGLKMTRKQAVKMVNKVLKEIDIQMEEGYESS